MKKYKPERKVEIFIGRPWHTWDTHTVGVSTDINDENLIETTALSEARRQLDIAGDTDVAFMGVYHIEDDDDIEYRLSEEVDELVEWLMECGETRPYDLKKSVEQLSRDLDVLHKVTIIERRIYVIKGPIEVSALLSNAGEILDNVWTGRIYL